MKKLDSAENPLINLLIEVKHIPIPNKRMSFCKAIQLRGNRKFGNVEIFGEIERMIYESEFIGVTKHLIRFKIERFKVY